MSDASSTHHGSGQTPESLEERVAQLEELVRRQQDIIAQQQERYDIIAQQQAELAALRGQPSPEKRPARTSRRHLLTSAGAAAAAVTAGAVALGANANVAHAASGGNWILGQGNAAENPTGLLADSFADPLLQIDNSSNSGSTAIQGFGGTDGIGVYGQAPGLGWGVEGVTDDSFGVLGVANSTGIGVVGSSNSGFDMWAGGTGRIAQVLRGSPGAPTSGNFSAGEQIRDSNAELWLCLASGSPGLWVHVPHAVFGYAGGATSYLSKPIRLLDSRPGATDALNNGGGPYATGSTHSLTVAGVTFNGVPIAINAVGAIGNVTVVTRPGANGFLALVPHGAGFSGTAVLAYGASQVISNSFNIGLSGGILDIIIGGTGSTDVIIDIFAFVA